MIKSEPILPLRIYSDLYDQNRFNLLCEPDCKQQLIYPTNNLPFFQFVRDSSLNVGTQLYIRNICNDPKEGYKIVPENITNSEVNFLDYFTNFPNGIYDCASVLAGRIIGQIDCGVLKNNIVPTGCVIAAHTSPPEIHFTTPNGGEKILFKIAVDKIISTSTFSIKIYSGPDGGALIGTISSAGIYTFEFESNQNLITIVFDDFQGDDEFQISHIQASYVNPLEIQLFTNDFQVDETKVKVTKINNGKDVVTYCESSIDYIVEPGDYYYILNMGGEIYFSEIFTLKTPIELEKYYSIFWFNTCDINDTIIYNISSLVCLFYHRLYFNAALFEPKYDTNADIEENGLGDKNITFKRWQKSIKLDIMKSPPFLTDALSAIFLHDTVFIRHPLNKHQEAENVDYAIQSITTDIQDILFNCFQSVKLLMVLSERYTGKNCCDSIELFDCTGPAPTLDNVSEPTSGIFLLEGTGLAGTFASIEYNLNSSGWVVANFQMIDTSGNYAILFDTNGFIGIVDLDVRIRSKTLSCDLGLSAVIDLV